MAQEEFVVTDKQKARVRIMPATWAFSSERVTGIEPALSAWEADVLPLNYTRKRTPLYLVTAGHAATTRA